MKMKEAISKLAEVLDRRDKLETTFHPDTPEELKIAIDTFFVHCKALVDYNLDFIPGEAVADLLDVLVKYPKYHNVCDDLMSILQTDYDYKV